MTSRYNVAISTKAPSIESLIIRVVLVFCSFSKSLIAFEPPVAIPRPVAPLPHASANSVLSFSSRALAATSASSVAKFRRVSAALNAEATSLICIGNLIIVFRRLRIVSSLARYLARPICPCEARAA